VPERFSTRWVLFILLLLLPLHLMYVKSNVPNIVWEDSGALVVCETGC
jgi:hypothetical protein